MLARVRGSGTIEGSTGTGIVETANAVKIDPACQGSKEMHIRYERKMREGLDERKA